MCISASAGQAAKFEGTKIYAGVGERDGKLVHVLSYQNTAEDRSGNPNAMVLPIPSAVPMTEANAIDTRGFKGYMDDIAEATKIHAKTLGATRGFAAVAAGGVDALVFDVGSYTVVLAEHVKQIPAALERVPEHKRPTLSYRFLLGMMKMYPETPIAVCCWSGRVEAEPLLWWYEPKDPSHLFIPTMDAHDGNAPDLEAIVETDHIVSVGTFNSKQIAPRHPVKYKKPLPDIVKTLLPTHVFGTELPGRMKNGDTFFKVSDLNPERGYPRLKRGAKVDQIDTEEPMYGHY